MANIVARRVASLVPILIVLSIASFCLLHLAGGSPAALLLGIEATPQAVAHLNAQMGFNRPLPVQYFSWIGGVLHGNFGYSYFLNSAIGPAVISHFLVTLQLTGLGLVIALLVGGSAGIVSAVKRGSAIDSVATGGSILGFAVPEFVLGLFLIALFAVTYPILPVQGYVEFSASPVSWFQHMILPAVTIGIIQAGPLTRIVRAAMLRTLGEDYMRTARAKGVSALRVTLVHALRPALLPILTGIGLTLTSLLGGAFVTEIVFHLPGLGELMLNSALNRDVPTLQAGVIFIGTIVLVVNLMVDISYTIADPRVRYR